MSLEKTLADIKKGKISPWYLLYGEEEYLIAEALRNLLELLVPEVDRDFCLFMLDGENADVDLVSDHLLTTSLLGGPKIVVVRDASLFQSQQNIPELIGKIRENLSLAPEKAGRYFLTFLKLAGFDWQDLQGGGWQKISSEQWQKAVEGDTGEDRAKWLPDVIKICADRGLNMRKTKDAAELWEELFSRELPPGNCLILTAVAADKRKKNYKILEKTGVILHFGALKSETLTKETLKQEAQKILGRAGKTMAPAAWVALGKKTGFQLRPSLNELQKLLLFVGEKKVIEENDVETIVGKTKEDSVFDLTTALSEKNASSALAALKSLLKQETHPVMILAMISREIRLLLHASILLDSGKLPRFQPGLEFGAFQKNIYPAVQKVAETVSRKEDLLINKHPYVIYNSLRHCRRFSQPVLIHYLEELLDIDRALKLSALEPQMLLERFLIEACR